MFNKTIDLSLRTTIFHCIFERNICQLDFSICRYIFDIMTGLKIDQMHRYTSPVNPGSFSTLSISLLGKNNYWYVSKYFIFLKNNDRCWNILNGMVLRLWSDEYKIHSWLEERNIDRIVIEFDRWKSATLSELCFQFFSFRLASLFLGYGGLFLLLWVGIYV